MLATVVAHFAMRKTLIRFGRSMIDPPHEPGIVGPTFEKLGPKDPKDLLGRGVGVLIASLAGWWAFVFVDTAARLSSDPFTADFARSGAAFFGVMVAFIRRPPSLGAAQHAKTTRDQTQTPCRRRRGRDS